MKWVFFLVMALFSHTLVAAPSQLRDAVGQMMLIGFNGTSINEDSTIVKEIKEYHIGGVILDNHRHVRSDQFVTNVESPAQLKKLISDLQYYAKKYHDYPLFIAVNQEGGLINTLKASENFASKNDPSEFELEETKNQKNIYDAAYKRARLLKSIGINLNLAPVADLNINPNNPAIGKLQRSFDEDPQYVTECLKSTIKAYKRANILCALKHFPGLGSASQNTDYNNADLTSTWHQNELLPYAHLIQTQNMCQFVMVTHLINRQLDEQGIPVSLSKKVVTDLLIKKLHFKGLIITDDMDAAAIRKNMSPEIAIEKAVLAGNNVIIYGGTQGYDPDQDAKLLFTTLIHLAHTNPKMRSAIMSSYQKTAKMKTDMRSSL